MKATLRRTAALLFCVSALFSLALFSACNNDGGEKPKPDDGFALTDAQRANILAISEAFAESGISYNSDNPLAVKDMEQFIYYLYNDDLIPDSDGYGTVSAEEAIGRIKMYFGISIMRHTQKNDTDQDFYFSDNKYYIKSSSRIYSSVQTEMQIVSCEQDEAGNRRVYVKCNRADGGMNAELDFVFRIEGNDTRVLSCTRYDKR